MFSCKNLFYNWQLLARRPIYRIALAIGILATLSACSIEQPQMNSFVNQPSSHSNKQAATKNKEVSNKPPDTELSLQAKLISKPLPPEKTQELVEEVGRNWLYGQGVGETALNAGTIIVFPPWALVVLGNMALGLSGYEPVTVSGMLPEKEGQAWSNTYDQVTEGPGRLAATVAGEDFRDKNEALARLKSIVEEPEPKVVLHRKNN